MRRHQVLVAAAVCGLALLASSCQETRPPSVRPGINDPYYKNSDPARWSKIFEGESRDVYRQRSRIVEEVGLEKGQTVADIGAGTGLFTMLFAEKVGPPGRVLAVDILPRFLEHIEKRARDAGFKNVETVLCREDSVALPADSIDVAFVCDTYHHFEYPHQTLASIHKALRTGGQLVVIDFDRIPGKSRKWVLGHVRADRGTVRSEIESEGFEFVERKDFLDENYFMRFRKTR